MLGILLLYFIGKYFYTLAEKYGKNKWLFAILGVVVYYVGTFIGGVVIAILDELVGIGLDWENNFSLSLIALPFGIATAYLFYFILKKQWKKTDVMVVDEIQDIGKTME